MLDGRIYRAAFLPVLLALVVAAFSLQDRPPPLASPLAPDAFDAATAMQDLDALSAAYPSRQAGGAADDRLAALVGRRLAAAGFQVSARASQGQTARGSRRLAVVTGTRTGFSERRIVVLAHRDALAAPSRAALSGTAALLELARALGGRTLGRTVELVSTSGGAAGGAGASSWAASPGAPVDAVVVLGGPAGSAVHRPLVVPWSDGAPESAPQRLVRTATASVAAETGTSPGEPSLAERLVRLAAPLSISEQGAVGAAGLPAVLVGPAGERGPGSSDAVSQDAMQQYGRGVLRTVTALDSGPPGGAPSADLVIRTKVLPEWAVRLLVAALALPALAAAIDGFARARRRHGRVGMWLRWVAAGVVPFLVAWLFVLAERASGLIPAAPPHPSPAGAIPVRWAALAAAALVLAFAWIAVRPLVLRLFRVRGDVTSAGAAAAVMLALTALVALTWARNPYTALLLIPLYHIALAVSAPEVRLRPVAALALTGAALLPFALVALGYGLLFAMGPVDLAWMGTLLLAGGQVGTGGGLLLCLFAGCAASVAAIAAQAGRHRPPESAGATVRGPASYAGPGSLGGTESALRR